MSTNGMPLHRYDARCACIYCSVKRELSPGNEQMAYQRKLAMEREQAAKLKAMGAALKELEGA